MGSDATPPGTGDRESEPLAAPLVICWAQDHGIPPRAALSAAKLGLDRDDAPDRLVSVSRELVASYPQSAVEQAAARVANDSALPRMLDLVLGPGSPSDVLRALERERVFVALARRLTVHLLRALAVGARLPERQPEPRGSRSLVEGGVDALRDLGLSVARLAWEVAALSASGHDDALDAAGWERRFRELSGLPLLASRTEMSAARLSLSAELKATRVVDRLGALLRAQGHAFAAAYRDVALSLWTAVERPLWPHRVLVPLVARLNGDRRTPTTALIVVDALRHDFFDLLDAGYLSAPGTGLERVAQHIVWSLAPTVTSNNMQALVEGRVPVESVLCDGSVEDDAAAPAGSFVLDSPEGVELVTIPIVDAHVHTCALDLAALADAVMPEVVRRVAPVVHRVPSGSLIIVTADHGFTPVPGWHPRSGGKRYRHGGLDPFEVLIPLGVYRKVTVGIAPGR